MTTIVRYSKNGSLYVLVGAGLGMFQSQRPDHWWGHWKSHMNKGEVPVALVSDHEGTLGWIPVDQLTVISVDGRSPKQSLDAAFDADHSGADGEPEGAK